METRISRLRARVGRRDEKVYSGVGYPWDSGFLSRILGQIDNRLIHRTVRNHEEMDFGLGPDLDLINTSVFICIR